MKKAGNLMGFYYTVDDYEHSGDLDWAVKELSKICKIYNVQKVEERDYEAESDYEDEYGELDEFIYKGHIEFSADKKDTKKLLDYGCSLL